MKDIRISSLSFYLLFSHFFESSSAMFVDAIGKLNRLIYCLACCIGPVVSSLF
jgi:hypothetical protein